MLRISHFARLSPKTRWWGGLCLLATLIALPWYLFTAPNLAPAPESIEKRTSAAALDPGAAQSGVAQSGAAASPPVSCASLSPFGKSGTACINFDPPVESGAANDSIMTEEKLIRTMDVSHTAAVQVLQVVPGASVRAMQTLKECRGSEEGFERNKTACEDIGKIMHYVLMDLDFQAGNGDSQAALLMAEFYAKNLASTHVKNIPYFLREMEKYARMTNGSFPAEVAKLQQLTQKYRS